MNETGKQWEGQVVDGKFELRQNLGGSDNGWVFLTEREGQKATIKLISADPHAEAQLSRWAQVANLSHPHLIRLFEAGRCRIGGAGLVYTVMEYADENLAEILPQRALTPAEASDMLPPLLDALAYLHGKGFAHGHIKPANILAVGDQVKISSDGICAMGEAPKQPSAYDAPEIAGTGCSAAADVWSLGMTLGETLTQQPPRCEQQGEPVLPGTLPELFLDIARNCLRRDPQRRWKISEISARLRPSASAPQMQVTAKPQAKPQKALPKWQHMVPAAVLVLLAVGVILVAPKVLNRLQGQAGGTSAVEPTLRPSADKPEAAHTDEQEAKEPSTAGVSGGAPAIRPVEAAATAKVPAKEVAPGEVVQQVVPDVPQKARDTIHGTVKVGVRVQVDPSGDVTEASLDSPGPSKYFANLAMNAAREWKFTPAASDGEASVREWVLRFEFTQAGTKAIGARAAPSN